MRTARSLTREERHILNLALRDSVRIINEEASGDLQDGLLSYYQQQAKLSDANVEAKIEREPFDMKDFLHGTKNTDRRKIAKGSL